MNTKTAIITGAASGIGLALANRLAKTAHSLFLIDRSEEVKNVAKNFERDGIVSFAAVGDVSSEQFLLDAAKTAILSMGGCAILVNCAGVTPKKNGGPIPLEEITVDEWEKVHRINLVAPVVLCREIIPIMASVGYGRVVNIASRAARMFVPATGLDYHASKAGLIGVSRALAGIYASKGVTVNCVAPGRVDTPMMQSNRPEMVESSRALIPAQRHATADEIAAAIEFLVSPDASYVTGTCMDVNGGSYMS